MPAGRNPGDLNFTIMKTQQYLVVTATDGEFFGEPKVIRAETLSDENSNVIEATGGSFAVSVLHGFELPANPPFPSITPDPASKASTCPNNCHAGLVPDGTAARKPCPHCTRVLTAAVVAAIENITANGGGYSSCYGAIMNADGLSVAEKETIRRHFGRSWPRFADDGTPIGVSG